MNPITQPLQVETEQAIGEFQQRYGDVPEWVATAPGRVNLIGEHTDYNLLPVLPMSIDRKIQIYCRRRQDMLVRVENVDRAYPRAEIDLGREIAPVPGHWTNYIRAALVFVTRQMAAEGKSKPVGMDMLVSSDLPVASGLSSSSALVIASCMAALHANDVTWSSMDVATRMTEAERFVGTAGGGMDQTVISMAENGSALLVEFAPLRPQAVQIPDSLAVYIVNSGETAEKTGAARFSYNRRSLECCLAVAMLARAAANEFDTSGWSTLRDVYDACNDAGMAWSDLITRYLPQDPPDLDTLVAKLGRETVIDLCVARQLDAQKVSEWLPDGQFQLYARVAHVMAEADRVYGFRDALETDDLSAVSHLANASHASCRDLYHISTPRLEEVAALGIQCGAGAMRITGAGFGGCLVGYVPAESAEKFEAAMLKTGFSPEHLIKAVPAGRAGVAGL